MEKSRRLNFWVSETLAAKILDLSDTRGWTITETTRHLMERGLQAEAHDPLNEIQAQIATLTARLDSLANASGDARRPDAPLA
jgi:hypothetical protein